MVTMPENFSILYPSNQKPVTFWRHFVTTRAFEATLSMRADWKIFQFRICSQRSGRHFIFLAIFAMRIGKPSSREL